MAGMIHFLRTHSTAIRKLGFGNSEVTSIWANGWKISVGGGGSKRFWCLVSTSLGEFIKLGLSSCYPRYENIMVGILTSDSCAFFLI